MVVLILLLLLGLAAAWIELRHRLRPASPLAMRAIDWRWRLGSEVRVTGVLEISNPHRRMEVFVPEPRVDPVVLGKAAQASFTTTSIEADHPDEDSRADGWPGGLHREGSQVDSCQGHHHPSRSIRDESTGSFDSLWADVHWITTDLRTSGVVRGLSRSNGRSRIGRTPSSASVTDVGPALANPSARLPDDRSTFCGLTP